MSVQLFLGLAAGTVALCSLLVNRDLFSPAKLYLLVLFVCFTDVFFRPYPVEVQLTYGCLLTLGAIGVGLEKGLRHPLHRRRAARFAEGNSRVPRYAVLLIWIVSLVPIAAQLYMIQLFGGLEEYVASINLRVLQWRGLGHLRALINTIGVIHVIYLAVLLIDRSARLRSWSLYGLHFAVLVSLALLSGSRGSLVGTLFFLLLVYNYLRRPIPIKLVLVVAPVLLLLMIALGVARGGYKLTADGLQTGLDRSGWRWTDATVSAYGLRPLELVYSRDPAQLQYGRTFASAVTIFVPRKIWPNKPDPGGIVLTKDYTGDRWGGASNLSPGIVAETVLNFGYAGVPLALIFVAGLIFANYRLYVRVLRSRADHFRWRTLRLVVLYGLFVPATAGLLFMEFTNTVLSFVVDVLPAVFLQIMIFRLTVGARESARLDASATPAHAPVASWSTVASGANSLLKPRAISAANPEDLHSGRRVL